jgi:hypothetical protein
MWDCRKQGEQVGRATGGGGFAGARRVIPPGGHRARSTGRRGRAVELVGELALPALASVADLSSAMSRVAAAATQGAITPDEALALSQMVESFTRTLVAMHDERVRNWRYDMWKRSENKTPDR